MFQMTPNILKNFFSKRATRRYPYYIRPAFDGTRGELYIDISNCKFCGICAAKCPSHCITVIKDTAKWECDPFACVYCGVCVEACKEECLHQKKEYRPPVRNREININSSSKKTDKTKNAEEVHNDDQVNT